MIGAVGAGGGVTSAPVTMVSHADQPEVLPSRSYAWIRTSIGRSAITPDQEWVVCEASSAIVCVPGILVSCRHCSVYPARSLHTDPSALAITDSHVAVICANTCPSAGSM